MKEWRAAARLAARQVRTGVGQPGQQVLVVRVDEEADRVWSERT